MKVVIEFKTKEQLDRFEKWATHAHMNAVENSHEGINADPEDVEPSKKDVEMLTPVLAGIRKLTKSKERKDAGNR